MKCMITSDAIFTEDDITQRIAAICIHKPNKDIVLDVSTKKSYVINPEGEIDLALIDYGTKTGIAGLPYILQIQTQRQFLITGIKIYFYLTAPGTLQIV